MPDLYTSCRFLNHGQVVKFLFENPQTNLFEDDGIYIGLALCDHFGEIPERVLLLDILLNHYVKQNKKKSEEDPYYYVNDDELRNAFSRKESYKSGDLAPGVPFCRFNPDVPEYDLHPMYVPTIEQYLPGFITSLHEYYNNEPVSNYVIK